MHDSFAVMVVLAEAGAPWLHRRCRDRDLGADHCGLFTIEEETPLDVCGLMDDGPPSTASCSEADLKSALHLTKGIRVSWQDLPAGLRMALFPAMRVAMALFLQRTHQSDDSGFLTRDSLHKCEECIRLALQGFDKVRLGGGVSVLNVVDAIHAILMLLPTSCVDIGKRWEWIRILTDVSCVQHVSVEQV